MTDTMLFGVLKMPFEMAMKDEISRIQFYARVQELVGRFEAQQQAEPVAWNAGVAPMWPQQKEGETFSVAYIDKPQQQAEPPPEWPLIKNILDEYGLDAIAFVAEWKAAQRPWVGLTDEEILRADPRFGKSESDVNPYQILGSARDIEAKLKEKNNG